MNRNNEVFSMAPQLDDVQRSKFTMYSSHHTAFDSGYLIPFYLNEVLPGDTFDIKLASSVRMSTPIVPVQDDCFLDTYFFYVPNRLCWNRFKEFVGENARSNWHSRFDDIDISIPKIAFNIESTSPRNENGLFMSHPTIETPHTLERSLVDYFGLPYLNFQDKRSEFDTDSLDYTSTFSALPFEAYNLIWNNFFRDKNYVDECPLMLQNTSASDNNNDIYYETNMHFNNAYYDSRINMDGYAPRCYDYLAVKPVSKFHDYFTSMLPEPQRGAPVVLPGFTDNDHIAVLPNSAFEFPPIGVNDKMRFKANDGSGLLQSGALNLMAEGWDASAVIGSSISGAPEKSVYPSNLVTDASVLGSSQPTINDLRNAFAIQRLLEKDARGGSLYSELVYSHFGVLNPESRVQLPEYLGGDRISINMEQVVQTSESNRTPQGNVSGLSLTNNVGTSVLKSFTEHGYIIGVCCVRPQHSYQNGVEKLWTRTNRFDFYYPALAHIGEQPVMRSELSACAPFLDSAIGYQEAWAEYRYKPSIVTGSMRTGLDNSLDIWHYGDAFNVPNGEDFDFFGLDFMLENPKLIDRTLAVSSSVEPQFFGDFYIQCSATRPMPIFSVPGLVDHH